MVEMVDLEVQQPCGHGYPRGDCPVCGVPEVDNEEPRRKLFDPQVWVAAYAASSREPLDLPADLVGVPLS
jgi:hypothetical protein